MRCAAVMKGVNINESGVKELMYIQKYYPSTLPKAIKFCTRFKFYLVIPLTESTFQELVITGDYALAVYCRLSLMIKSVSNLNVQQRIIS